MSQFAKVYASLWTGTLRGRLEASVVFVYMLANCDRQGVFDQTPQVISDATGMPVDQVIAGINFLQSPDPESRTAVAEGRRIAPLSSTRSWGWQIINYKAYRNDRSGSDAAYREANLEAIRARDRERKRASTPHDTPRDSTRASTRLLEKSTGIAEAEAEGEVEEEKEYPTTPPARSDSRKPPRVPAEGSPELPTNNGQAWQPTQAELEAWTEAYRSVDVKATLAEIKAWLIANPNRRKTLGGMARFVNTWLKREHDRP